MSILVEIAVMMLNAIGGENLGKLADHAITPVSQASPVAYEAMRTIADTVVRPVASVILSLILVVELARNASRFDNDGQMGVRIIAGTMFKFVLLIVAVQYAPQILEAINGIAETIMQGIFATSELKETTQGGALGEAMRPHLNPLNAIAVILLLALPAIISLLAVIVAQAVIIFRFVEIYALTAFATLPVAFAGHPDTKSISVGYLRAYASVAIQGATLVLGIFLYQLLVRYGGFGFFPNADDVANGKSVVAWSFDAFFPLTLSGILMIFVVIGSNRLAKSVVGQGG